MDTVNLFWTARKYHTQKEIADWMGCSVRTVKRWEVKEDGPPYNTVHGLQQLIRQDKEGPEPGQKFTFIDLFAGIGGMRLAFEQFGGRCVFTSEWDKYAQKTYISNFKVDHDLVGDITEISTTDIPDHDILLAGFPCQPFSIAGVSKKNSLGRKHGFEDKTQGTLFFDVARVIKKKQPVAFLLENVKNLASHDKGNTLKIILETLRDELGYTVATRVIDSRGFVPQHRERIFIVGFREDTGFSWDALKLPPPDSKIMGDILHPQDGSEDSEDPYTIGYNGTVNKKYILSEKLWSYLQSYADKHKKAGNGFGYGLVTRDTVARTLSARYYKDGSEILVSRGKNNPRRLTPRECSKLMGYQSDNRDFKIPVSDTQSYKQFGNGVVVPVVTEVARIMQPFLLETIDRVKNDMQASQASLIHQ